MNFKLFLEATNKNVWFHGDPNKRENFCDQKMDRDPFIEDPNANGPGIYFTKDYNQARGYAEPDGYVYTVKINPSAGYIIREDDKVDEHHQFLFKLLKKAQDLDPEAVYYAVTDYGYEIMNVEDVRDGHLKRIIESWDGLELIDAAVMSYKEFFGRNANAWANAMKELGILGYIQKQPETDHLIVYNCQAIKIIKEEKYVPEKLSESSGAYEPDEKHSGLIPEIKYLPVSMIVKSPNELEVSTVPDDVAQKMDFSEPIEVIAYRYSSDHTDTTPQVTVKDGHHRFAAAKQIGREWLPVQVDAINAKGYKLNDLINASNAIQKKISG